MPLIGEISLGKDMKEALKQAEDAEADGDGTASGSTSTEVAKDAKGRPILTLEQRLKKEEKDRKIQAEASHFVELSRGRWLTKDLECVYRNLKRENSE